MVTISAQSLGNSDFRREYRLRYAYVAGAMYQGIGSKELVVAMGKAGMIGFLGTGGLGIEAIEKSIVFVREALRAGESYGANLLSDLEHPEREARAVDLYLRHGVPFIEAAAYVQITAPLVRLRLQGVRRDEHGLPQPARRVLAKISRPEVATAFLAPAPDHLVSKLVTAGELTAEEAELGRNVPMASDICVEADSGGHTDGGVAYALLPAIMRLRDLAMEQYGYERRIAVGAAGGIGTPHAVAASFAMGADFVLTGSINQCTVEAGTSAAVKDLLQQLNVQDTAYAPAGDMFELGARVQVAKRGNFFAARANKLYELYQRHGSLQELDAQTRQQLEEKIFRRSFAAVWNEARDHYARTSPQRLADIERNPKRKMAAVFKWYFAQSTRLALAGDTDRQVDYQIHCGPALGAFNQWVRGSELEPWRNRHVAEIATKLMHSAADLLEERFMDAASAT